MFKKFFSKKGQVSMEIGILLSSSILVSVIASYYYVSNYINTHPENIGKNANNITHILNNVSVEYANSISNV